MSADATTIPPVRKDRVRLVGFMAKKEGLSDAEFYRYWHEVHGPVFANLEIVKKNILKFEQVRSASSSILYFLRAAFSSSPA